MKGETMDILDKFLDGLEETFAYVREREGGDSVCGLCEYDGAYIGESGDWCNECPGFNKDDCFKLSDEIRKKWKAQLSQEGTTTDTISRQAAIDALWKALCEYEDKTEKQFQESDELDVGDWILHRIFVQNMSDIDRRTILELPPAQPEEAIPVSWIEAKIARFMSMDNAFAAGLTANIIKTMLNEWRKEARSEREHNK